MIPVTQPNMPPIEDYLESLKRIWTSKILTNKGEIHDELSAQLSEYLKVQHLSLCSSGTMGLLIALKALNLKGEVITTPYTFAATSNALMWSGLKPIFVDIEEATFNMDPSKIESAITKNTSAILAVHAYGNPCKMEAIKEIAQRHNLKIIYDAAHAFGVEDKSKSILEFGDISVLSFHATKIFTTGEGGAIISRDADTKQTVDRLINFGLDHEFNIQHCGINGKLSELHAAFGLAQLKNINQVIKKNSEVDGLYRQSLKKYEGIACWQSTASKQNYSYFPISIKDTYPITRDALYEKMILNSIGARRYFYPLVSELSLYQNLPSASVANLPIANKMAKQILCLPIYANLSALQIQKILQIL